MKLDPEVLPKSLGQAVSLLRKSLLEAPPEELKYFQELKSEKDFLGQTHFGLGMWLRNNWKLWQGGPLSESFNKLGITHADDMSGIILTSFWRYMHEVPLRLSEQVQHYKDFWATMGFKDGVFKNGGPDAVNE